MDKLTSFICCLVKEKHSGPENHSMHTNMYFSMMTKLYTQMYLFHCFCIFQIINSDVFCLFLSDFIGSFVLLSIFKHKR